MILGRRYFVHRFLLVIIPPRRGRFPSRRRRRPSRRRLRLSRRRSRRRLVLSHRRRLRLPPGPVRWARLPGRPGDPLVLSQRTWMFVSWTGREGVGIRAIFRGESVGLGVWSLGPWFDRRGVVSFVLGLGEGGHWVRLWLPFSVARGGARWVLPFLPVCSGDKWVRFFFGGESV